VLERVCGQLGITLAQDGKKNPADFIAEKIITHAQRGVRTEVALYVLTMEDFKPSGS
jgi:hypothetical protein